MVLILTYIPTVCNVCQAIAKADGTDPIDALIAATAINEDLTLATQNAKHFRNIKGLKLEIVKYPADLPGQE